MTDEILTELRAIRRTLEWIEARLTPAAPQTSVRRLYRCPYGHDHANIADAVACPAYVASSQKWTCGHHHMTRAEAIACLKTHEVLPQSAENG